MTYCKLNINAELRKVAKGKKTKLPADLLRYLAEGRESTSQKRPGRLRMQGDTRQAGLYGE